MPECRWPRPPGRPAREADFRSFPSPSTLCSRASTPHLHRAPRVQQTPRRHPQPCRAERAGPLLTREVQQPARRPECPVCVERPPSGLDLCRAVLGVWGNAVLVPGGKSEAGGEKPAASAPSRLPEVAHGEPGEMRDTPGLHTRQVPITGFVVIGRLRPELFFGWLHSNPRRASASRHRLRPRHVGVQQQKHNNRTQVYRFWVKLAAFGQTRPEPVRSGCVLAASWPQVGRDSPNSTEQLRGTRFASILQRIHNRWESQMSPSSSLITRILRRNRPSRGQACRTCGGGGCLPQDEVGSGLMACCGCDDSTQFRYSRGGVELT